MSLCCVRFQVWHLAWSGHVHVYWNNFVANVHTLVIKCLQPRSTKKFSSKIKFKVLFTFLINTFYNVTFLKFWLTRCVIRCDGSHYRSALSCDENVAHQSYFNFIHKMLILRHKWFLATSYFERVHFAKNILISLTLSVNFKKIFVLSPQNFPFWFANLHKDKLGLFI